MPIPGQSNANELLQSLRTGDRAALNSLYDQHRAAFFHWAGKRFHCDREALEDAWQDAVIVFYDQVKSGRLAVLSCSVRTYLFAVGFRVLSAGERKRKRISQKDEIDESLEADAATFAWDDPWLDERETLLAAMEKLSLSCRQMLKRRYFEEKSLAEVQVEFGYNSLNTLHASLSRCLKKLKEIIADQVRR
ncbi:MAG: sigma-70 family RNA polymerase sigma factor [Bacteroidota bacterium]